LGTNKLRRIKIKISKPNKTSLTIILTDLLVHKFPKKWFFSRFCGEKLMPILSLNSSEPNNWRYKMLERTKEHILLALSSDPDISGQLAKRVFSLLEGKSPRRKLISTRDACEILNCHPITLRRLEKRGHFKAIRLSARKIRWDRDEIQNFADYGISDGGDA
jgi:predicted DNA-binding transcriptional regulator AlpA